MLSLTWLQTKSDEIQGVGPAHPFREGQLPILTDPMSFVALAQALAEDSGPV